MSKWWGWSSESTMPDAGYFFCPQCQRRQRTGVHRQARRFHLCRVAIHTEDGPAYYRCEACAHEYPAVEGHGYDFSDNPEPSTWACFKCGGIAPGHLFACPHCGFSLNRTLESISGKETQP
jgi:hypothetical protein